MIGISLLSKLEDSSKVSTISNTPDCKTAGTVESCGVGVSAVNRVHSKLPLPHRRPLASELAETASVSVVVYTETGRILVTLFIQKAEEKLPAT